MTDALQTHLEAMLGPGAQFREGQREAIEAVARDGSRTLVVQRTGWGKSLVYWIATRVRRDAGHGPTLIVSPLLALMRNQIELAGRLGIRAVTLNSSMRNTLDKTGASGEVAHMDSTRAWVDRMHASGRLVFSAEDARSNLDMSMSAVWSALSRAQAQGLLFSPARGFYVVVPADYRTAGTPPWQWYLDPMMRHLNVGYYAGLLTAAAHHGASPQAAQEIQVVVERQVRDRPAGRARLRFVQNPRAAQTPIVEATTPTGRVRISTPEVTMLDLVAHPRISGGWGNIASLVAELGPRGSKRGWQQALGTGPAILQVQRLGYLLDRAGAPHTDELSSWLASKPRKTITLVPRGPREGEPDARWRVIPDPLVQAD